MPVYPTKSSKKNKKNKKFKWGVGLTSVFSIVLLFLLFNFFEIISITILGTFGLIIYPLSIFFIVIGILLMMDKTIKTSKSIVILSILWLFFFTLILQLLTSSNIDGSFGGYMLTTFKETHTAGGIIFGAILYPLHYITYDVAVYVLLTIALVITTAFIIDRVYLELKNNGKRNNVTNREEKAVSEDIVVDQSEDEVFLASKDTPVEDDIFISDEDTDDDEIKNDALDKLGLFKNEVKEEKTFDDYKTKLEKPFKSNETDTTFNNIDTKKPNIYIHEDDMSSNDKIITREQKINDDKKKADEEKRQAALAYLNISKGNFQRKTNEKGINNISDRDKINSQTNDNLKRLNNINDRFNNIGNLQKENIAPKNPFKNEQPENKQMDIYDNNLTKKSFEKEFKNNSYNDSMPEKAKQVYTGETKDNIVDPTGYSPIQVSINDPVRKPKPQKIYKKPPKYIKPPIDLLPVFSTKIDIDDSDMMEKGDLIVETLRAFKIETKIINAIMGPTFTRYELQMAPGISVNTINNKINDLSMALESSCRVQVPIPGKNAFGIEVPNKKRITVGLREMLESQNFQTSKSPLTFALGKNINGECKVACIDKLVHTLVAGSTNSGKSVCLTTMLLSLLYKASPEDLRLILVDPKTVEFSMFNNLPHMLIPNTITDCEKAVAALNWLVEEMDRRYKQLNQLGVKKISEYNETAEVLTGSVEKMFYIVLVFDEVGDFMNRAKKEIENAILLLAAKSRACGIHIVLATQRPTTDVITGTIKTNLPSRIAFAVNSSIDSKVILECTGAESLLGMGDMLFFPQGASDPDRMQGCFADTKELKKVIDFIKENNEAIFDEEIEDQMFNKKECFDSTNGVEEAFDPLLKDCLRYFIKSKKASASSLQGYFGIGYPKANKIVLQMEKAGFVSAGDSNNRRTLFITQQEFEEKFGEDLDES